MSKPKMYGQQTQHIPNSKADMRHRKRVYQRGREKNKIVEKTVVQTERRAEDGKE